MDIAKTIKTLSVIKDIPLYIVAQRMGITRQNLYNKISKNNFSLQSLEAAAAVLGCRVVLIDNETGKIYE